MALTADEVRERAAAGALLLGLRGVLLRIVGLAGNIVLARLLLPADFGLIAFAASVTFFASAVADSGLGAGLIRRKAPPTGEELRAFAGFQLLASTAFAAVVALCAFPFGRPGAVAAVMVASLPLLAFRTPGALLLERQLDYRPLVAVEFAETVAFNAFAITSVALGAGVWGMAAAATFRTFVGALLMIGVSPAGLVLPRFKVGPLRPLLKLGAQFQAVGFMLVARGLVVNAGVAAIGGLRILGLWAIAERFLSVLALVLESLWRVSFPMMSRLIAAGDDVRTLMGRNIALITLAVGFMGCVLVGAVPALIPTLLGAQYGDAAIVFPPACLAVVLNVPVGVAVGGYLYADGRAGAVLLAVTVHSLLWFAVTFPLLPLIGVAAVGVGSLVGGGVSAVFLVRAADLTVIDLMRPSWRPLLTSVVAGAGGLGAVYLAGDGPLGIVAGGSGAGLVFLGVILLLDRGLLSRAWQLLRLAARRATRSPSQPAEAAA